MDTTAYEDQVVTESPIGTAKKSPSAEVPVFATRSSVDIVTIAPTDKGKHHFNLLLL